MNLLQFVPHNLNLHVCSCYFDDLRKCDFTQNALSLSKCLPNKTFRWIVSQSHCITPEEVAPLKSDVCCHLWRMYDVDFKALVGHIPFVSG